MTPLQRAEIQEICEQIARNFIAVHETTLHGPPPGVDESFVAYDTPGNSDEIERETPDAAWPEGARNGVDIPVERHGVGW